MCKFWLLILHARINLDFNLQCIYTIFNWVTVIDKFVHLLYKWHNVAEMHITIWLYSNFFKQYFLTKGNFEVVEVTFEVYPYCNVYFYYLCHKWHKFNDYHNSAEIVLMHWDWNLGWFLSEIPTNRSEFSY